MPPGRLARPATDTGVRRLSLEEARRIAVRAQLLEDRRPTDLAAVVERLTFLQLDPTATLAPSADLVAWSRLGRRYEPADLVTALEADRTLFEHRSQPTPVEPRVAMVRPMADLGLFLAEGAVLRPGGVDTNEWVRANEGFRQRILAHLRDAGPLSSRDIPDTSEVPWASSGWTNDRNVTQMLEFMATRGDVAVAGRRGRERVWDLPERVYPPRVVMVPLEEARAIRADRWLKALGVARPRFVGQAGLAAEIDGIKGAWRVDPAATADGFTGRTALLSPFDRLSHDRARAKDLFDFDYGIEMYKPKEKRRWGFFALPMLNGDSLVGKLDAAADRADGVLRVAAIHFDVPADRRTRSAIEGEVEELASWLGLAGVRYS